MTALDYLRPQLDKLERDGLLRRTSVSAGVGGKVLLEDGRTILNFSSNDYLNLAQEEHVKSRAHEANEPRGLWRQPTARDGRAGAGAVGWRRSGPGLQQRLWHECRNTVCSRGARRRYLCGPVEPRQPDRWGM